METKSIKSGLIEKRSKYLKIWRTRQLVLTEVSLFTQKSDHDQIKPTMMIQLKDIIKATPVFKKNMKFTFVIVTNEDQCILRAFSEDDMLAWLNLINHLRQGNKVTIFNSRNYHHESKVLCDKSLIISFTKMKELLYAREEELLNELDETYKDFMEKSSKEYREISKAYEQEAKNCLVVESIMKNNLDFISKIREIQNSSRSVLNFKEIEKYNGTKLVVSMRDDKVEKLINNNIKVSLDNPAEVMVRRTNITRALKWRYAGERVDALAFSVDNDIVLTAVGVCSPYKTGRITVVKEFQILKGGSTNSPSIYKHQQKVNMTYSPESSVFKINLESQIPIKHDTKYTVYFIIEGSHTYKCVDCISFLRGPGNVQWSFINAVFSQNHQTNRCDAVCGPIADFYYIGEISSNTTI